jgi:hypothetical protein
VYLEQSVRPPTLYRLLIDLAVDILEKLLDKVDVCHDHAPAAVPLAAELIQSIAVNPSAMADRV